MHDEQTTTTSTGSEDDVDEDDVIPSINEPVVNFPEAERMLDSSFTPSTSSSSSSRLSPIAECDEEDDESESESVPPLAEQADEVFIVGGSDDNDEVEDQVPAPLDVVFIVGGSNDNEEVKDQAPTSPSPPVPPSPPTSPTPPPVVDSHLPPPRRSRRIAMMTPPVLRRSPRLALLPRVSYVGMF